MTRNSEHPLARSGIAKRCRGDSIDAACLRRHAFFNRSKFRCHFCFRNDTHGLDDSDISSTHFGICQTSCPLISCAISEALFSFSGLSQTGPAGPVGFCLTTVPVLAPVQLLAGLLSRCPGQHARVGGDEADRAVQVRAVIQLAKDFTQACAAFVAKPLSVICFFRNDIADMAFPLSSIGLPLSLQRYNLRPARPRIRRRLRSSCIPSDDSAEDVHNQVEVEEHARDG